MAIPCPEVPMRLAKLVKHIAETDATVNSYDDVVKRMEKLFPNEPMLRTAIADDFAAMVEEDEAKKESEEGDKAEKVMKTADAVMKTLGKESKLQKTMQKLVKQYTTLQREPKNPKAVQEFENARIQFFTEAIAHDRPIVAQMLALQDRIERLTDDVVLPGELGAPYPSNKKTDDPEVAKLRQELSDLEAVKRGMEKLAEYEQILATGEIPETTKSELRTQYGNEWWITSKKSAIEAEVADAREKVNGLAKKLREPERLALKKAGTLKALQGRIDVVMDKLSTGNYSRDPAKPKAPEDPEIAAQKKELSDLTKLLTLWQEITDLDAQIAAGKKRPKEKTPPEQWGKLMQMKDIRNKKKAHLETLGKAVKVKGTKQDATEAWAQKLQEHLTTLQKKVSNKDFSEAPKKAQREIPAEIAALKAQISEAQRVISLNRSVMQMKEDIKKLDVKALTAKYSPKPKPTTLLDPDVVRAQIEADRLRDHIRAEIEKARPKPFIKRLYNGTNNFLVDMLTSFDMGHIFRQGNFMMFSHPGTTLKVIAHMLRHGNTEMGFRGTMKWIENHPDYLPFANRLVWEDPTDAPHGLNEEIRGSIARRIPGVKWSQYTYATFVNRLRMESASGMLRSLGKAPTNADLDFIAKTTNTFTGKGNLGKFQGAQGLLDAIFLATRWRVSRFQTALGVPLWQAMLDKNLSKGMGRVVAGQYMRYIAWQGILRTLGVWAFMQLFGSDEDEKKGIEKDWRSSQFGKFFKEVDGYKQFTDFAGGMGAPWRLIVQTLGHQTKSASTGDVRDLKGGQRAKPALDWLRQGLGPMAALASDLLIFGDDPIGRKIFEGDYDDAISQLDRLGNVGLEGTGIIGSGEATSPKAKAQRAIRYILSKNIPIMSQDLLETFSDNDMPDKWTTSLRDFVGANVTTIPEDK